jgi:FADH2 O2-dependent halogenase
MRREQLSEQIYDLAIVGSGFAGSLLALIARRLGYSVVLIERGSHPRIVIGESTTPLTNLFLESLADRYNLPEIRSFSKWGTWHQAHPEIACGLKRGFSFFHHSLKESEAALPRERQLLVAASPHDAIADTHWYRADFDEYLMKAAVQAGAEYFDQTNPYRFTDWGEYAILECTRRPIAKFFRARFVLDATGPRGFLHRNLKLGESPLPEMPPTQAFYAHFSGVGKLASQFPRSERPPYPIDAAAVHHVFPGGWIWVLQFNNGITSAGVACTDETAADLGFASGRQADRPAAWHRLLDQFPSLRHQFANARIDPRLPFTQIPRLTFRSAQIVGPRWAQLPSAAGFIDPLLSTGFPLTLLGIERFAAILEASLDAQTLTTSLQTYANQTDADLLAAARLIAALYASMDNFPVFTSLTMLYFAAVSYAETAHRLGKPHLASSFLLHADPHYGPAMQSLIARSRTVRTPEESAEFSEEVRRAIDPINVAGLADPARLNWYPVAAEDLLNNAHKLQATRGEIENLLDRCGFRTPTVVV